MYETTRRHMPEDRNLYADRCGKHFILVQRLLFVSYPHYKLCVLGSLIFVVTLLSRRGTLPLFGGSQD